MKRLGEALNGVGLPHKRESQIGRVATAGDGGRSINVTNMNNSQLSGLMNITPFGISSSPPSGLVAFVIESNNSGKDGMMGVFDPNKPKCKSGDVILYSTGGAKVECRGDKVLINDVDILDEIDKIKKALGI